MLGGVHSGSHRLFDRPASYTVRFGLDQLVRRHLRGVWVRGTMPSGPAVWAANHHSWWDFFVAAAALRSLGRADVSVLMSAANIGHRDRYRWAGVIGTDELRLAAHTVAAGAVLVVFPEGRLRPAGPLGPVQPGAAWLAGRAGAPVFTVATRVLLRGQQAPEAYLDVAPGTSGSDLGPVLRAQLGRLDGELAASDPDVPLPGFTRAVVGVRSWQDRLRGCLGIEADPTLPASADE
jgi:hypothetical protein